MTDKLLLVTFEYGHYGPEGICTQRLTEALRAIGQKAHVLTSTVASVAEKTETTRLSSLCTHRFPRAQALVGQLAVGVPLRDWGWAARVARHRPEGCPIVYGRGNPLTSQIAAAHLARAMEVPLCLHFSDPQPNPWENPKQWPQTTITRLVSKLLNESQLLTFTTDEAISYMESFYGMRLRHKAIVISNIVPTWPSPDFSQAPQRRIAYIGEFYGKRSPFSLLSGIALHNQTRPFDKLQLLLVGTHPKWVIACQQKFGDVIDIQSLPRTQKVLKFYHESMISASLDADDACPVFLATKGPEAVLAARRVLYVSPPGSPARRLFDCGFRTVQFATHDSEQIAVQIARLLAVKEHEIPEEMPGRQSALGEFSGPAVARKLQQHIFAI